MTALATCASVPEVASPRAWIALGVGAHLPGHLLEYTVGACRRMQAGLLLLALDERAARALLIPHRALLDGIACRALQLENVAADSVIRALEAQRGVLFAVAGEGDDPLRPLLRARNRPRIPVPLVRVSRKDAA